jgi:hypothetical protein
MQLSRLVSAVRRRRDQRAIKHQFVFVVTYGRSGSTLTQGLLNTLPRTLVRGENNFYVLPLFRAQALAQKFRRKHLKHNPASNSSAFYGLNEIKPRDFVVSTRQLMTGHMLGSVNPRSVDVLGFKEVLWHRIGPNETERFFSFLDQVFPGAKYVLNRRDHAQVAESGFWRSQERDTVMKAIARVEDIQDHLRRTRPDRVFDTRYELVTSDDPSVVDGQLRGLAEFVTGSCDDVLLEQMRGTLSKGHGPNPFGKSKTSARRRQATS